MVTDNDSVGVRSGKSQNSKSVKSSRSLLKGLVLQTSTNDTFVVTQRSNTPEKRFDEVPYVVDDKSLPVIEVQVPIQPPTDLEEDAGSITSDGGSLTSFRPIESDLLSPVRKSPIPQAQQQSSSSSNPEKSAFTDIVEVISETYEEQTSDSEANVTTSIGNEGTLLSNDINNDESSSSTSTTASGGLISVATASVVEPLRPKLMMGINRKIASDQTSLIRQSKIIDLLCSQDFSFSNGLAKLICRSMIEYPLRIWLLDNSGSMAADDGLRLSNEKGRAKQMIKCTRWEELKHAVAFHARLAARIGAPTIFQFVNDPAYTVPDTERFTHSSMGICIRQKESHIWVPDTGCSTNKNIDSEKGKQDLAKFLEILEQVQPKYVSPIAEQVYKIRDQIKAMESDLLEHRQKVAVIIATDAVPSDPSSFQKAVQSFENLPVWVVIRLCTNEEEVVHFWETLDLDIEVDMDVLDDVLNEAEEVNSVNPWLIYGEPLHLAREWGAFYYRILDLIDERQLNSDQLREFCAIIFGVSPFDLSHPDKDWDSFYNDIVALQSHERKQWSPVNNAFKGYIDTRKMGDVFGGKKERRRRRNKKRTGTAKPIIEEQKHLSTLYEIGDLEEDENDDSSVSLKGVTDELGDVVHGQEAVPAAKLLPATKPGPKNPFKDCNCIIS